MLRWSLSLLDWMDAYGAHSRRPKILAGFNYGALEASNVKILFDSGVFSPTLSNAIAT